MFGTSILRRLTSGRSMGMKIPRLSLAAVAVIWIFAGCCNHDQENWEVTNPSAQTKVEPYSYDGSLRERVGRDVLVTGYVRHEGRKGWPHLEENLSGESGVALLWGRLDPKAYLNRYVEVV